MKTESQTLETAALTYALDNDDPLLYVTIKRMLPGERRVLINACERLLAKLEQANEEHE